MPRRAPQRRPDAREAVRRGTARPGRRERYRLLACALAGLGLVAPPCAAPTGGGLWAFAGAAGGLTGTRGRAAGVARHGTEQELEKLAKTLGLVNGSETVASTLNPTPACTLAKQIASKVDALLSDLGQARTDLEEARAAATEAQKDAAEVGRLSELLAKAEVEAAEAARLYESCDLAMVDIDAALGDARASATKAEARAFAVEMKATAKDDEASMTPLAVQLNASKYELLDAKNQTATQVALKEAAVQRSRNLAGELDRERQRTEELSAALRDIGKLVGVGGPGGIMTLMMSDDDVARDAKEKIRGLQALRS